MPSISIRPPSAPQVLPGPPSGRRREQRLAWRSARAALALLLVATGCPDLSLPSLSLPDAGGVREGGALGGLRLLSPPSGERDVPTNLVAVVVDFGQSVAPAAGAGSSGLELVAPSGPLAVSVAIADESCPAEPHAACWRLVPSAPLPPATSLVITYPAGALVDAAGPLAVPLSPPGFMTGDGPVTVPPRELTLVASGADDCLVARLDTDRPATCALLAAPDSLSAPLPLASDAAATIQHTLASTSPPWPARRPTGDAGAGRDARPDANPDASSDASIDASVDASVDAGPGDSGLCSIADAIAGPIYEVTCSDLAGNVASSGPLPLPARPSFHLVINEVLANAAGGVDAELVELYNPGPDDVPLGGSQLVCVSGSISLLPDVLLPAHAYALVVGSAYAPGEGDAVPDASALLLNLAGRLCGSGLPRDGSDLELVDPAGVPASTEPGGFDVSSKANAGRSVERIDPGGCSIDTNFAPNRTGSATPGYKNSVTP